MVLRSGPVQGLIISVMSGDGRNKKKPGSSAGININLNISNATDSPTTIPQSTINLPIGDPFERILTTPKGSLIQRAASPRRSPLKSVEGSSAEICLEHLPKLSGKIEGE